MEREKGTMTKALQDEARRDKLSRYLEIRDDLKAMRPGCGTEYAWMTEDAPWPRGDVILVSAVDTYKLIRADGQEQVKTIFKVEGKLMTSLKEIAALVFRTISN